MNEQVRDRGSSFVELLTAITITGVLMVGVMGALRTTVDASTLDRDHANAHAWLQTATDVLYQAELQDCGTQTASAEPAVRAAYQNVVRATSNPKGWPADHIEILAPVLFWDGQSSYQSTCYDDIGISLQLITIQVRGLDGRIVESVQVVKG